MRPGGCDKTQEMIDEWNRKHGKEPLNEVLGKYKGRWALLSIKTGKPLAYAPGTEKPSEEWVAKQEARVEYFKHMKEDSTPSQMSNLDGVDQGVVAGPLGEDLPKKKTKKVKEEYGAGEDGSKQAAVKYKNDTPGQEHSDIPSRKVFSIIKHVLRDKYKKKRKLI